MCNHPELLYMCAAVQTVYTTNIVNGPRKFAASSGQLSAAYPWLPEAAAAGAELLLGCSAARRHMRAGDIPGRPRLHVITAEYSPCRKVPSVCNWSIGTGRASLLDLEDAAKGRALKQGAGVAQGTSAALPVGKGVQ